MRLLTISLLISLSFLFSGCYLNEPAPKPVPERVAEGVTLENIAVGDWTRAEVIGLLNELAQANNTPPVNSGFSLETGEIIESRPGKSLNYEATLQRVFQASPGTNVTAVYDPVAPAITTEQVREARRLGSYVTEIKDTSPGRLHNIELTAALINNTWIEPGQEFFFNRLTGEPTAERGFQPATIFTADGQSQGLGGGMCQVSSTLYNAVLEAGLPVTERHPHSQPVTYVPPGRDATTYTDKDFRFRNSLRQPLLVQVLVIRTPPTVNVHIWQLAK